MCYVAGDVVDHDDEVYEARWFAIDEATQRLAFKNEQNVVVKAQARINQLAQ
jgi:NADH pyrophosphatase NudC (nudix superfamily)